ncbi:hypothetical protein MKW92_032774 [Papaver armeniacum]|nr:hypothetical protein MKW92_032774 [Papaver armeniacum]
MLLSAHLADSAEVLHGYINFVFLAYRHCNYMKAIEFVQFRERMEHYHQYLMSKVESFSVLERSNYGIELLELCEQRSKSLTFNEDTQSRPWWTPSPDCNHILAQFDEDEFLVFDQGIWQQYTDKCKRELSWCKVIERRSLLPRLIYLSIHCASLLKEYGIASDSPSSSNKLECEAAAQSESFGLIERYATSLDLSYDVASSIIAEVSTAPRSVEDIPVRIMIVMSFGVVLASWRLKTGLLFVVQIVKKPIAWKSLVFQSCIRVTPNSSVAGAIRWFKLTSEMTPSISSLIQSSSGIVEGIIKFQKMTIREGPGLCIQILEAITPSLEDAGPNIAQSLRSCNFREAARKMLKFQRILELL